VFDLNVYVSHAHFSVGASQNDLDGSTHLAKLTPAIRPTDPGFGSTPGLSAFLGCERIEQVLEVMV
jgi:hypothetical protein